MPFTLGYFLTKANANVMVCVNDSNGETLIDDTFVDNLTWKQMAQLQNRYIDSYDVDGNTIIFTLMQNMGYQRA